MPARPRRSRIRARRRLVDEIVRARAGELEHKDTALAAGAKEAPAYEALTAFVKAGSKLAIWLSERV